LRRVTRLERPGRDGQEAEEVLRVDRGELAARRDAGPLHEALHLEAAGKVAAVQEPELAVGQDQQPRVALVAADLEAARPGALEPGRPARIDRPGIDPGPALSARAVAAAGREHQR